MSSRTTNVEPELLPLDTSDIDERLGKPIGGMQLREPVTAADIRAWAQAMHNPNRLHIDRAFAEESTLGGLYGAQSFITACDYDHGALPASQGAVPGSHKLWGGSEWFFYGPRVAPGDAIRWDRMPFDYRVKQTRFAGPTLFQRGDDTAVNDRGEIVAKVRTTTVRYLVENVRRMSAGAGGPVERATPRLDDTQREQIQRDKLDYYRTFHGHVHRTLADVQEGERLPTGVIGPHSIATLATEWRAYLAHRGWGSTVADLSHSSQGVDAGSVSAMAIDHSDAELDPAQLDIVYNGPARGHLDEHYARLVGMPRPYGFGASQSAWIIDYAANWAGEDGFVVWSSYTSRSPVLVGDATYLRGTVTAVTREPEHDVGYAEISVELLARPGDVSLGIGKARVRLPLT
jgi:acyl dehydratase